MRRFEDANAVPDVAEDELSAGVVECDSFRREFVNLEVMCPEEGQVARARRGNALC